MAKIRGDNHAFGRPGLEPQPLIGLLHPGGADSGQRGRFDFPMIALRSE